MTLPSEGREKASEARQFWFTNNLFDAKTVFPFCASGTGVVSPLPYAVVDSATLHNLKEAPVIRTVEPFTGAVLCKHRVAEHRDGGLSFNTIRPFTAPACWPESAPHRNYPGQLISADTLSAFYLTGCGLHCRKALLPRGRKTAPETQRLNTAPVPVRHFNRAKRESDARNPFRPAPENSTAPAHGWSLTPPFRPFT